MGGSAPPLEDSGENQEGTVSETPIESESSGQTETLDGTDPSGDTEKSDSSGGAESPPTPEIPGE